MYRGSAMPVSHGASRLTLCLLLLLAACDSTKPDTTPGGGGDNDKVAALRITPNGATLLVGESLTLAAQAVDDTGHVLEDVQVTWTSYLPQYATVSSGQVEGVSAGGSVITATVGSVSATLSVVVLPDDASRPSSHEVLETAREAGLINDEELLAYQVYAAFSDPRLPVQYKARVEPGFDATALEALHERFDTLSSPMQDALGMYLLRPDDPGSWLNAPLPSTELRSLARPTCRAGLDGWHSVSRSNTKVKIWFEYGVPGQREKAVLLEDAVEKEIWPKLMALGLKEPLTDEAYAGCNGGSSQVDLYLVRNMTDLGLTLPAGYDDSQTPTYILLSGGLSIDELKAAAAHEVMHAIQWSYKTMAPQPSYGWIRDATATWAIDYVYGQTLQLEQDYADCFMSTPGYSLEDRSAGNCSSPKAGQAKRDYGAYLFFQYLAKKHGPNLVTASLEKLTKETSALSAVDAVIPGKFKEVWPEFAKVLWNQAPIDTQAASFKQWDQLSEKVRSNDLLADLAGAPEARTDLHDVLSNLSSRYYHFTFSDTDTRSIRFHNGWFQNITQAKDPVKVSAFWSDASGTWHEEDWSDYEDVGFCRDLKSQRVQDLVIITSNAKFEPGGGGKLTSAEASYLERNNVGCWKFKGTSKAVQMSSGWTGRGKILDANLEFEVLRAFAAADYDHPLLPHTKRLGAFLIMSPSARFTLDIQYVTGGCGYRLAPTEYTLGPVGGGVLLVNPFKGLKSLDPDTQAWLSHDSRAYTAALADGRIVDVTVSGSGCTSPFKDAPGHILVTNADEVVYSGLPPLAKPDGALFEFITIDGIAFNWTLQPQREP
ncbi:Ig-like domain-containing protein [Corallococcus llansteffanensis]|uniref:Ig-like domain-containing protein n=2 Tax=Corallococcus llansteffanensis TaxID=2316731 RepID=A0A3A8QE85_9BACT|nr:Ig-like domain-containing protein [Corallococcus llansteffanensis]